MSYRNFLLLAIITTLGAPLLTIDRLGWWWGASVMAGGFWLFMLALRWSINPDERPLWWRR